MSRFEEAKKAQEALTKSIDLMTELAKSEEVELDTDTINSMIFSSITQILADISITLAIISDKMGGDEE